MIEADGGILRRLREVTAGEFRILRRIGRGGMASVFLAHEVALQREVAIKVMAPGLLANTGMVRRFRDEAVTVARLRHPNIIVIHGVRDTGDLQFFIMQFVPGCSLEEILRTVPQLPIALARAILFQVGKALAYAHRNGIVHRDVKPANLLVDGDGNVIVTDFGIAKAAESPGLTQTGVLIGTPTYMSPEQFRGQGVTFASDQYALGVVAYELLAGRPPFQGSAVEVMQAHLNDVPTPLRDVRSDCPAQLDAAIARMLAKEPAERWAGVSEALSALEAAPLADAHPIRQQFARLATRNRAEESDDAVRPPAQAPPEPQAPARPSVDRIVMVDPPARIEVGDTVPLRAAARDSAGVTLAESVVWSADRPMVATIDSRTGLLTAHGEGRVEVSASAFGVTATHPFQVHPASVAEVVMEAGSRTLEVGEEIPVEVVVRDRRGVRLDRPVALSSNNHSIVSLAGGTLVGVAPGSALVEAACEGGRTAMEFRVVRARAAVLRIGTLPEPLLVRDRVVLDASARDARGRPVEDGEVSWTSNDESILRIDDGHVAEALSPGSTVLTATCDGVAAQAAVRVSPRPPHRILIGDVPDELRVGEPFQLVATVVDDHGDPVAADVVWRSDARRIAAVTKKGLLRSRRPGPVTLHARFHGLSSALTITVLPKLAKAAHPAEPDDGVVGRWTSWPALPPRRVLFAGAVTTAMALIVAVFILNGQPDVGAGESEVPGVVARSPGGEPEPPPRRIDRTLATREVTLQVGDTFGLMLVPDSGVVSPRWASTDSSVASVDDGGLVRAAGVGTASISVEIDEVSDTARIVVVAAPPVPDRIVFISDSVVVDAGSDETLVASVVDGEGRALAGQALEWRSSNPSVAAIDLRTGRLSGLQPGRVEVTARSGSLRATIAVLVAQAPTLAQSPPPVAEPVPADTPAVRPVEPPPAPAVTALTAGGDGACVVASSLGTLCWGNGAPLAEVGGRGFDVLAAGARHRCGLAGGSAHCWGANEAGQLGDGSTTTRSQPVVAQGSARLAAITAGGAHTCALDRGGAVYCWGSNAQGQLGTGRRSDSPVPLAVEADVAFEAITAGLQHTCALAVGGSAHCWGDGFTGALGNNMNDRQTRPFPVQTDLTFRKLVAGDHFTCGLSTAGRAYCWGDNRSGQLGDASTRQRGRPVPVDLGAPALDIAAGSAHACAVLQDGRAACWGDNADGQIGDGTTNARTSPVQVVSSERFTSIAAGARFTCGRTSDHAVLCWGDNSAGQLGSSQLARQSTPVPLRLR